MKKQVMKKFLTILLLLTFSYCGFSQDVNLKDLNSSNTWLKVGLNAGLPIGDISDYSAFTLGLDANIQFLRTKAYGIGLKAGYIHYFAKDDFEDFGMIPLAVLFRFYPQSSGIFFGLEAGYALANNLEEYDGGAYFRPHIGWHNHDWNFFAYYDHILGDDIVSDIQTIGVGVTYNIYFK